MSESGASQDARGGAGASRVSPRDCAVEPSTPVRQIGVTIHWFEGQKYLVVADLVDALPEIERWLSFRNDVVVELNLYPEGHAEELRDSAEYERLKEKYGWRKVVRENVGLRGHHRWWGNRFIGWFSTDELRAAIKRMGKR